MHLHILLGVDKVAKDFALSGPTYALIQMKRCPEVVNVARHAKDGLSFNPAGFIAGMVAGKQVLALNWI